LVDQLETVEVVVVLLQTVGMASGASTTAGNGGSRISVYLSLAHQ
jgi:hypothetical protein